MASFLKQLEVVVYLRVESLVYSYSMLYRLFPTSSCAIDNSLNQPFFLLF